MRTLNVQEVLAVAGGDAETKSWGKQLGEAISEMKEHAEAAFLGPVLGTIYLATRD